ncbi:uncharacterized protein LOC144350468 [Saccoglossus kowalevskii]
MLSALQILRHLAILLLLYILCSRMPGSEGKPLTNDVKSKCILCQLSHGKTNDEPINIANTKVRSGDRLKREAEHVAYTMEDLSRLQLRHLRDIQVEGIDVDLQAERMGDVLSRLFDVYDLNSDGVINRREFTTVFRFLH